LKGNDLFADGKTDEAIEMYSKAIELEKSHIYYSNRSAAYLKKGEPQKALDDANMCLELNPDFEKGYHRKGAALQGLKKFDEAVAVYDDGISKFPESEELKKKLEKSKLAKESASELAQSVRSSKASMLASKSKQQKAADSQDLSAFVQNTKIALELQIIALKAQLDLVKALGSMSDDAKMKLLFQLVDVDQDGKIDARELADAIRKRNAYLSLSQSLERAISFVAAFDENNDAHLDFSEFTQFLNTFADSMGVSFHGKYDEKWHYGFLLSLIKFTERNLTVGSENLQRSLNS
jgi:Ca2+-binding EF-hand superfamily protein